MIKADLIVRRVFLALTVLFIIFIYDQTSAFFTHDRTA